MRLQEYEVFDFGPVEPGSVVVVRGNYGELVDEADRLVGEIARVAGHSDFSLVFLGSGMGFDVLDEQAMASHGWYRPSQRRILQAQIAVLDAGAVVGLVTGVLFGAYGLWRLAVGFAVLVALNGAQRWWRFERRRRRVEVG